MYAGIGWQRDGYELATVDDDGRVLDEGRLYPARDATELIRELRRLATSGGEADLLRIVVESTNGTIDGRLMAAGLRVHRADPALLPARPTFGSVPAVELARAARAAGAGGTPGVAVLQAHRGTQTGREDELAVRIAATALADDTARAAGRLVEHGPREQRRVALTFDDGPLPPFTGRILDVLERYGVPATFFCVGINSGAFGEELVRMREQGHAIGNHTWSHPFLFELTGRQLVEQVTRTSEVIAEVSGGPLPRLFRPPYGSRTPDVLARLAQLDTQTVLWDVAPDDWALRTADGIARDVIEDVRPGSIVLLHDGGGDRSPTLDSVSMIIDGLLERGYTFVRVDDLVGEPGRVAVPA